MHLDHVGIAVEEVQTVIDTFDSLLGIRPYKSEAVPEQQVRTHFLDAGTTTLELLESLDPDSPVQRFLDRRGEGLHHVAFEVRDLSTTLDRLRSAGFTVLQDDPQPGADEKQIAFVHPKETHGVLVEFCKTAPPAWTPTTVAHNDGELAVFERGERSRPTLLLLHGSAGSTRLETAPLMRRLESAFHLVGIDLSGHGDSSFPSNGELTMEQFVSDVNTAVEAVDTDSCHLFGFSLGTAVALLFAAQYPESVDRLALFGANASWTREDVSRLQDHLHVNTLRNRSPAHADRLMQEHDDLERLFGALRSLVNPLPSDSERLRALLPEISVPTLVAGMDRDPVAPVPALQTIHQALPDSRLAILPGERHSLPRAPLSHLAPLVRDHLVTS